MHPLFSPIQTSLCPVTIYSSASSGTLHRKTTYSLCRITEARAVARTTDHTGNKTRQRRFAEVKHALLDMMVSTPLNGKAAAHTINAKTAITFKTAVTDGGHWDAWRLPANLTFVSRRNSSPEGSYLSRGLRGSRRINFGEPPTFVRINGSTRPDLDLKQKKRSIY